MDDDKPGGRTYRSPTRTTSNRGPKSRFIGRFPCSKSEKALHFDSVSSLFCALWLEWRNDILRVAFEPKEQKFEATGELPAVTAIPDFGVVFITGELGTVEAKYSRAALKPDEQDKLTNLGAHLTRKGEMFEVAYRMDLEQGGFIETVLLLRPYGHLNFPEKTLRSAHKLLGLHESATLWTWRARARAARVPVAALYHLLYKQALPLTYEPLIVSELSQCRA